MRFRPLACLLFLAVSGTGVAGVGAADGPTDPDRDVIDLMKQQIDFLFSVKKKDNWTYVWRRESPKPQESRDADGETGLVAYALLNAGKNLEDPRLKPNSPELAPVIKYLCDNDERGAYGNGLAACALALVPKNARPDNYDEAMERIFRYLNTAIHDNGGYDYIDGPSKSGQSKAWDHSNTQYGVLGMWALQDADFKVPPAYWKLCAKHWHVTQDTDGGWAYNVGASTLTMTAAGIASTYISNDFADDSPPRLTSTLDKGVDGGLTWMGKHFEIGGNAYGLYGIERVGLASGRRFLGDHNWFEDGVEVLKSKQAADGSTKMTGFNGGSPMVATAYALLFLGRGLSPVAINKLQYGPDTGGMWNARPRDDANLTAWTAKQLEHPLKWQIASLKNTPEEWADAPVLLVTGSADPKFTDEDVAKLRTYVEEGGTIFSSADGNNAAFTAAVKRYAGEIVDGRYEMRELPKDHPLFTSQFSLKAPPRVLGLSNGVREWWIHSPADLGAAWQKRTLSPEAPWELGANVYQYATGKVVGRRHAMAAVSKDAAKFLAVARLRYKGNWDPEPGAWPAVDRALRGGDETALTVTDVPVEKLDPARVKLAYLTGTGKFTLTSAEVSSLKRFVEGGGTLVADAAGSSKAFADGFRMLSSQLFPDAALDVIPADDPLHTGSMAGGVDVSHPRLRRASVALGEGKPNLFGVSRNNRWAVIFSPEDMGSGMVGVETVGTLGLSTETARGTARNIALYVAANGAVAAEGK